MTPKTVEALAKLQFAKLGWWDGIYAPRMDAELGFCVFAATACPPLPKATSQGVAKQ